MGMSPQLLRPRATGFNPASIAGIVHWWDANDAASLTINSGAVQAWTSKAGTKTVASQSTANNRPVTTTVNGKTALLFDGSNDGFDFTGDSRTDETWVIAGAQLSDQTASRAFISDASQGFGISAFRDGSGTRFLDTAWGDFSTTRRVVSLSLSNSPLPPSVIAVVRSSAGGVSLFRNGSLLGSPTSASLSVAISRIGYLSSATIQLNGWIGDIICYSRAISSDERVTCERALGSKWGITVA